MWVQLQQAVEEREGVSFFGVASLNKNTYLFFNSSRGLRAFRFALVSRLSAFGTCKKNDGTGNLVVLYGRRIFLRGGGGTSSCHAWS